MEHKTYLGVLQSVTARFPAVISLLHMDVQRQLKAANSMTAINKKYHDTITKTLIGYFEGGGSIAAPRNKIKQAMSEAFLDAFVTGWTEAGADLPLDDDALAWLSERQAAEFGFIDGMFQDAAKLRKEKDFDYFTWANVRADGYTSSLGGVFNAGAMLANDRQMLEWHYGDTDHCDTCLSLNGQKHRASWYLSRSYIPRQAGSNLDCGGFNCQCYLTDKKGNEITI